MSTHNGIIYFDNNATTQVSDVSRSGYLNMLDNYYANPASTSQVGVEARLIFDSTRASIVTILNAKQYKLYFTSGSTEGNNMVLQTYLAIALENKKKVLTSKLEHSSVLNVFKSFEERGLEVVYLNARQLYDLDYIPNLNNIYFASLMSHNNESGIGTDLNKVRKILGPDTLIHSDITQSVGKTPVDISELKVDFFTFSGHKFHSPKGVGGLLVRKGLSINPLFIGGGQEESLRPGTSNLASVVAMQLALRESVEHINENKSPISDLRDQFEELMKSKITNVRVIGGDKPRLPNTSYIAIKGINSDILVSNLKKLAIGNGSACNSYSHEVSHVAREMTMSYEEAKSVIRVSFSRYNNIDEVKKAVDMIMEEIQYIEKVGI